MQETIVENRIASENEKKLSRVRPDIDNLLHCDRSVRSAANRYIQLRARPRPLSQRRCDQFWTAGENSCALNSAALQCAQKTLQYRNTAQLNQGTGAVSDNNTFMAHLNFPDIAQWIKSLLRRRSTRHYALA